MEIKLGYFGSFLPDHGLKSMVIEIKPVKMENAAFSFRGTLYSTNKELMENQFKALEIIQKMFKKTTVILQGEEVSLQNYFEHKNPEGQDPTARAKQAGYTCHKELGGGYYTEGIAENIFQNYLYDSYTQSGIYTSYDWNTPEEIAKSTVNGWMHSSGHRQNILTTTYDRQGIGVAVSGDNKVYITEDFC